MYIASINDKPVKDDQEIVAEDRREVHMLSQKYIKGLPVWEFNPESGRIRCLKPLEVNVELTEKDKKYITMNGEKVHIKYEYAPNCRYLQATNIDVAKDKFIRQIGDAHIEQFKREQRKTGHNYTMKKKDRRSRKKRKQKKKKKK